MASPHSYPFRLGTSSYIIPADIVPNVEFLSEKVDDIEIVLFESDEYSNLPGADAVARLKAIAAENALTYSIHLPLDVYLGNADRLERERSAGKCRRIIELTRCLPVSAFVLHGEAGHGIDASRFGEAEIACFRDAFRDGLKLLLEGVDAGPEEFAIETLGYPFTHLWPVADELGLSVTLDIGHLELYRYDVALHLERYLPRTRVFHMHGIREGRDHNSLAHMRAETLDLVLDAIHRHPDADRVFTMEIFSLDDFEASCRVLEERGKA